MNYVKLRDEILSSRRDIDSLEKIKDQFQSDYIDILNGKFKKREIDAYIRLCLDYYTCSSNGDVLISDHQYDTIMNYWISKGNDHIIYQDAIVSDTVWPFVKHEMPGMVGTISKIYTEDELVKYLNKYRGINSFIVAPKYDGISTCIKVRNGVIDYAVTRADGIMGQNITAVVKGAKNSSYFAKDATGQLHDGYYKCELCVGQNDFDELIEEKNYKNRRSATAGIINSPKNLQYARFITIIPLLYNDGNDNLEYKPIGMWISYINKPSDAMTEIEKMLKIIKCGDFQFRTDGVILYPLSPSLPINHSDYMENAIAYKINTAEGKTKIKYGYMSVGRMGNAIPMVKVYPVEVNETIVEDVSLGSYDKYASMDIHEDESVIVYSAGDVIPQLKLCDPREYDKHSDYLLIKKVCPYCNEKLSRIGNEYKCTNPGCPRIITGKITNFLVKLGAENISDRTIEILYANKVISSIADLFSLTVSDLVSIDGIEIVSATNIVNELKRVFESPISISKLLGAVGIPNISEKKCRNIFKVVDIDYLNKHSYDKIWFKLLDAENVGSATAKQFASFYKENQHLIRFLLSNMNIIDDIEYKGNVVFTGFRNDELANKIKSYGYDVGDTVNNDTVALIDASTSHESTKCKTARKKGVSILDISEVDELLKELKKHR